MVLDDYRLNNGTPLRKEKSVRDIRPYLRGPIDMQWLISANKESHAALVVGLSLWHFRSLHKSPDITLGIQQIADKFQLSRDTARRGVRHLEDAGLITVDRPPGRKLHIKLPQSPESSPRIPSEQPAYARGDAEPQFGDKAGSQDWGI